jgi:uncharacterized membrane protein (UPF0127 family)
MPRKIIYHQPVNYLLGNQETVSGGLGPNVEVNPMSASGNMAFGNQIPAGLGVYCRKSDASYPFDVKIGNQIWHVKKAENNARGLKGTEGLEAKSGMFFHLINTPQVIQIDMHNMNYPIDIIFVSGDNLVSKVLHEILPRVDVSYVGKPVMFFIEVNAGEAEDIKIGDQVQVESYESKIEKEHQPNPPFPGLIYDEYKHRWVNPEIQGIKIADEALTNHLKEMQGQLNFIKENAARFSKFGPTQKVYFSEMLINIHKLLGRVGNQMYDEVKQKKQEHGIQMHTTENPQNPINRAREHLKDALKAIRDNQPMLVSSYLITFAQDYDEALHKYEQGSQQKLIQKQEGGGVGTIALGGFTPTFGGSRKEVIRKKIYDLMNKSKVYLEHGENPPEGIAIQQGKRGGKFYESTKVNSTIPKDDVQEVNFYDKFQNAIKDVDKKDSAQILTDLGKIYHQYCKNIYQTNNILNIAKDLHADYKSSSVMEGSYALNLYIKSRMENIEYVDVVNKSNVGSANKTEQEYRRRSILKKFSKEKMEKFLSSEQEILKNLLKDNKIKIYRGCDGKTVKDLYSKGEKIKINDSWGYSRWTLSKKVARTFAKERHRGIVLSCEVSPTQIVMMDGISGIGSLGAELEVGICPIDIIADVDMVYT